MSNIQKTVAINIRRLRIARGVSQERLAREASLDRGYISAMELCKYWITIDVLDRIARALDVKAGELLHETEEGAQLPPSLKKGRKLK